MLQFKCGTLPHTLKGEGSEWLLKPLSNARESWEDIQKIRKSQTLEYPPKNIEGRKKLVATHLLIYRGRETLDRAITKKGIAAFLIYALGAMYGNIVQHKDWFVTGFWPVPQVGHFIPNQATIDSALELLPIWYTNQKPKVCLAITSAFFLHNQIPLYPWDWEQFAWQYAVFDGCWFVAKKRTSNQIRVNRINHHQRLKRFTNHHNIQDDATKFSQWVKLRNALIHQVTWDNSIPTHRPTNTDTFNALPFLRNFCTHALFAATQFESPSLKLDWRRFEQVLMEPPV